MSTPETVTTEVLAETNPYAEPGLLVDPPDASAPDLSDDSIPLPERIFNEAERIDKNTRHTKYQHKQFIDEATGTYYVDCSDYVSYVLSRIASRHLALIPKEDWWPVPRAFKFYEYFAGLSTEASPGWLRVERLEDARRGDIIAWELSGEVRENHDTGHVIIVTETPSILDDDHRAVRAYDSAALVHYSDTRKDSDGVFHKGVGAGTFHLRVDRAGKPVAFQFGPGDHFHTKPVVIGRILPL